MPIAVVSLAVRKSIHREVDGTCFGTQCKSSTFTNGLIGCYRGGATFGTGGSSGSSKRSSTGSSGLSKSSGRSSGSACGKGLTGAAGGKQSAVNGTGTGARSSYSSSATLKAVSPALSKAQNVVVATALLKKGGRGSREAARSF